MEEQMTKLLTAVVAGTAGYFVGKFLDQTGVGRQLARAATPLINAGLTFYHQMAEQANVAQTAPQTAPPQQPQPWQQAMPQSGHPTGY